MLTRDDRRAALILVLLAAAGLVVRFWQPAGAAPGGVVYRPVAAARPARESVAARAARLLRPLGRGERIDLDRASAEELTRLPRVGPGLAARIVTYREVHGPFGSLRALDAVPGIGPTALAAIGPHATFSATPRVREGGPEPGARARGIPLIQDPDESADPIALERPGVVARVSLNTASEADLVQLPGIGPVLAHAIVADRKANGPFESVAELARVPGIGAALLRRLKDRIVVP